MQADRLSKGLRPLVCLAGALVSFQDGADDVLERFSGRHLSAATVRRVTEQAGQRLLEQQRLGRIVVPKKKQRWDFRIEGHRHTVAYLGLDAFSVPIQKSGGKKAEGRMLYTGILYTPSKSRTHYLVDFELDLLVSQMRAAAKALGLGEAQQVIAVLDGGNGLEAAIHRHFWDDLLCILDWYHASEHLYDYAGWLHPGNEGQKQAWAQQAKGILYEQGGKALVEHLEKQEAPQDAKVADELRKLVNYLKENEGRTDYPSYRKHGYDIGSGPTEAACKVVGARLKGSGMRWLAEGAAQVAPLRALYQSGPEVWDAFWAIAA